MKKPLVSIVILNYDGKLLTKNLLVSIKKIDFPKEKIEIIIVDNGSSDGSQEFLKKNYPHIKLIENKRNLGFDEGMNIGVNASYGKYVAMLNNDIIVDKNWLKELVKAIESNNRIGIVEPKIYNKNTDGKYAIDDFGTTTLFHTLAFRKDVKRESKDYVELFVSSSACLFRRNIVDAPFDKDYFAYAEDTYFGWLVRLKGYEIIHAPESVIYHEGSSTIKKLNKARYFDFLAERNKLMNMLIFYEIKTLLKLAPLMIIFAVLVNMYDFRSLLIRLNAYIWIMRNFSLVLKKRADIQKQRKVPDSDIIKHMSCKFIDERNAKNIVLRNLVKILNKFSCLYCRIVNIITIY